VSGLLNALNHSADLYSGVTCQLFIHSWVGATSTSQRTVTPCGWGVKAGMVLVW